MSYEQSAVSYEQSAVSYEQSVVSCEQSAVSCEQENIQLLIPGSQLPTHELFNHSRLLPPPCNNADYGCNCDECRDQVFRFGDKVEQVEPVRFAVSRMSDPL